MMNSVEFVDSLIEDCNNAVSAVARGQYILWCRTMVEMVQKLALLKSGVVQDSKSKDKVIEVLKEQLREHGVEVEDLTAEDITNGNAPDVTKMQVHDEK